MIRVRLVHWKEEEIAERLDRLRSAGFIAETGKPDGSDTFRALRSDPPGALLIDLSRLPSHGRVVALTVRQSKWTRAIPLVFVDGDPEKVAQLKELLPDATYTSWARIRTAISRAVANAPLQPVIPPPSSSGYSGTALPKKLGIKPESTVALIHAPADFESTLGELPDNVTLRRSIRGVCDIAVWFAVTNRDLDQCLRILAGNPKFKTIWIAWPKQASGKPTELTQQQIRESVLAVGWVDFKVCAIDATWSGLCFARRKNRNGEPG